MGWAISVLASVDTKANAVSEADGDLVNVVYLQRALGMVLHVCSQAAAPDKKEKTPVNPKRIKEPKTNTKAQPARCLCDYNYGAASNPASIHSAVFVHALAMTSYLGLHNTRPTGDEWPFNTLASLPSSARQT